MEKWIGFLGIIVLLLLAFLLSNNKRKINPRTFLVGLGLQVGIGFLLLKWKQGNELLQAFAEKVTVFLGYADQGALFLFGNLASPEAAKSFGFIFAFRVLPLLIFFAAFVSILYYFGILQRVVQLFAFVMSRLMKTSGAESLSCAAEIFVGPTEAPLVIRPYLAKCTLSEITAIMVGGFATIAGTVMAAYIAMGIPADHIIIASAMSAPAALMIAKIIFPETEHSETAGDVSFPKVDAGSNLLDAIARGVHDGLVLALNVAAMLVAFIALIALLNGILGYFDRLIDSQWLQGALAANGEYEGYFPGSLKTIFGTFFSPLAFVMGIPKGDIFNVGNLLGIKISINEFVAYAELSSLMKAGLISEKAQIMATYMLCGFANFGTIGISIGGLSALAPSRRADFAKIALRAMFGGFLATCLTGTIVGLLL